MKKILIVLAVLTPLPGAAALAAGPADVTVRIEGTTDTAVDKACDNVVASDLAKYGAAASQDRGLYMLQNCRVKNG